MGTTRKTITVTDQQDKWIKTQIEGGDFTNDSEYIRDLIRSELIKGEQSGEPQPFDGDLFKEGMTAKHVKVS